VFAIANEIHGIPNRVFLLHKRRLAAILEVVAVVRAHEVVANTAKVDPHVRELMRKERPGVKQFTVVDFLPLVGRAIGVIALSRQRMRWRTKAKDVQQQTFVVTLIAVWDEAGLGPPAMGQTWPTIPGPIPVCPPVKRISQGSDLDLVWR